MTRQFSRTTKSGAASKALLSRVPRALGLRRRSSAPCRALNVVVRDVPRRRFPIANRLFRTCRCNLRVLPLPLVESLRSSAWLRSPSHAHWRHRADVWGARLSVIPLRRGSPGATAARVGLAEPLLPGPCASTRLSECRVDAETGASFGQDGRSPRTSPIARSTHRRIVDTVASRRALSQ